MEEKPERKPTRWWLWLVIGLLLLVGYPLSIGPAFRLTADGYLPDSVFDSAYWPVLTLQEQLPSTNKLFWTYLLWWNPIWR